MRPLLALLAALALVGSAGAMLPPGNLVALADEQLRPGHTVTTVLQVRPLPEAQGRAATIAVDPAVGAIRSCIALVAGDPTAQPCVREGSGVWVVVTTPADTALLLIVDVAATTPGRLTLTATVDGEPLPALDIEVAHSTYLPLIVR